MSRTVFHYFPFCVRALGSTIFRISYSIDFMINLNYSTLNKIKVRTLPIRLVELNVKIRSARRF